MERKFEIGTRIKVFDWGQSCSSAPGSGRLCVVKNQGANIEGKTRYTPQSNHKVGSNYGEWDYDHETIFIIKAYQEHPSQNDIVYFATNKQIYIEIGQRGIRRCKYKLSKQILKL